MSEPTFWDHRESAQKDVERVSQLKGILGPLTSLEQRLGDLSILQSMVEEETSPEQKTTAAREVAAEFQSLTSDLEKFELRQLLSGEFDKADAFLTIHAGAG